MVRMRRKNGFIFTLTVLLLFSSLFIITAAYLQRNLQQQDFIINSVYADKISFVKENIVSDYYSMLDINFSEIKRDNRYIYVDFGDFSNITPDSPYQARLNSYKSFIEDKYGPMINSRIQIENFVPEFSISPYNSTFLIAGNQFYLYTNTISSLVNASVTIHVNDTDPRSIRIPADQGGSYPAIHLTLIDGNNSTVINTTRHLSPYTEGNYFQVYFNNTPQHYESNGTPDYPSVYFEYGRHREIRYFGPDVLTNGTMYLKANYLDAKVENLDLTMTNTSEKVVMHTLAYLFIS